MVVGPDVETRSRDMKTIIRWVTMSMMPVMLALGLVLSVVGGTLAQEEHTPTTVELSGTTLSLAGSEPGTDEVSTTNDLRGKILRITPTDDGSYSSTARSLVQE
jgi:hypothetical protein